MTYKLFAEKHGVTAQWLCQVLNGQRPSDDLARRMAETVGRSYKVFFGPKEKRRAAVERYFQSVSKLAKKAQTEACSERLLNTRDAAKYLGVKDVTLKMWRHLGKGPKYTRVGYKLIRYDIADLESFIRAGSKDI